MRVRLVSEFPALSIYVPIRSACRFESPIDLARRHEAGAVVELATGEEVAFRAGILLVAGPARAKDAVTGAAPRATLMEK